jgi:uncharacterized protein YoxC
MIPYILIGILALAIIVLFVWTNKRLNSHLERLEDVEDVVTELKAKAEAKDDSPDEI